MAKASKKKSYEAEIKAQSGVKVVTPAATASFPKLFKPEGYKGSDDKKKYSVVLLFDKKADLSEINKAIFKAKKEVFGSDKESWPEINSPWRDGDDEKFEAYPDYAGKKLFTTSTQSMPAVVGRNKEAILDPEEIYAGCIVRASVMVKIKESGGEYFAVLYLQAVQKLKDGPRIGRGSAAEDFDDLDEDSDESDSSEDEESYEDGEE